MSELLQGVLETLPDQVLPAPDSISYYVLEKERIIYLDFDVSSEVLTIHRMIVRWNLEDKGKPAEERKPIKIYVMSYGGEVDSMWMLIDAIKASTTPIHTINCGVAASAAASIFISGHVRYMMPNAKVVIHEGSAQFAGDAVKVMDASDSYKKELKRMKDFILANTQINKTLLYKKRNNDWELDAAFCLENKVCDYVVSALEEVA
jgi:ATP-dependent Clp protease protease subunit